jgi:hypothetical protein
MTDLEHGQGEDLVVVFRAPDEVVAGLVKGLLEGEGISVVLESKQVAWMDGLFKMGEGYWGDVVVQAADADRASELIAEYRAKAEIDDSQAPS